MRFPADAILFLRRTFVAACAVVFAIWFNPAAAQAPAAISRAAASFDRSALTRPASADRIRATGSLGGAPGEWGITGSLDYDVVIAQTGWYELLIDGVGDGVSFVVDPRSGTSAALEGARGEGTKPPKAGNVYLAAGKHTLRLQQFYWTGFPQLRGFTLSPSPPLAATSMRAVFDGGGTVFAARQCPDIEITAGASAAGMKVIVQTKDARGGLYATQKIDLPASQAPKTIRLPAYCSESGRFLVEFNDGSKAVSWRDVPPLIYEVIDTKPSPASAAGERRVLVQDIDTDLVAPDFSAGGSTPIVAGAPGRYRESGDNGFTQYQRAPGPLRAALPEPSWFAYRLDCLIPQRQHVVEIDYPDDALRTQLFVLRESVPLVMVAGGVDTGGEFSLTGKLQRYRMVFWPKSSDVRLLILNAHGGRHAAVARIRVYRVESTASAPVPVGGRQIVNWYEEGSNFIGLYGAPSDSPDNTTLAISRWTDAIANSGATTVMPTVSVYSFGLYPSRFNRAFSRPETDVLRNILLHAERRNLKVIPDLHPRADELDWPFADAPDPKPNLLVSKEGRSNYFQPDGKSRNYPPLYNPLHPANQDWYVGMVGELADRYRDSPALAGISLRLMQWANPALNNFNSLDWAYDDYTIGLFSAETKIVVPPVVPASRQAWLMTNAKQAWIQWRCEKIAQLYTRLRDRVRQSRADLNIYSPVFFWEPGGDIASLRAAGIDPVLLGNIDGVILLDAQGRYGRRETDPVTVQRKRDALVDPLNFTTLVPAGRAGAFLSTAEYVETTDAIAPPERMGFARGTKAVWNSAAVSPAGRHALERYALQLAETDAQIFGEGGNGYSLPQAEVQEFLAEYRSLPARHFTARVDARDPVAAWELAAVGRYYFYFVNRERFSVDVRLQFTKDTSPQRLSTGLAQPLKDRTLQLRLLPYQLAAYSAAPDQRLRTIEVAPPPGEIARVSSQVDWLEKLAGNPPLTLGAEGRALLHRYASMARDALDARSYRRARMLVEHHELLNIYRDLHRYPPDLLNAPVKSD